MKIVSRRSNLSLLYLVIFLGDILISDVRSKPVITGSNVNSLSKFESNFDKDYFTSYKNESNLNTLKLIAVETPLQEPDMPHQEAISRMKITGQPTHVLSQEITQHIQSSEYNHIGGKTPTAYNTRGYSYTINPSPTKSSDDAYNRGPDLLPDVDNTNVDSSITSRLNGNRKVSISALMYSSYSQMSSSSSSSYDLYQFKSGEVSMRGLEDSDFQSSMGHVDLLNPVDFDPTMHVSSARSESDKIEVYHYISKSRMDSYTKNGQYLDDFTSIDNQNSISAEELPLKSSLIELHSTMTFSTEQSLKSFNLYSTDPLYSFRGSFKDFESEIPGPSLTSSIISRTSFTDTRHDGNLEILNLVPTASHNEMSSTGKGSGSYFQPTMPNMHRTQSDDVLSGFSILSSVTEKPLSDPSLYDVATPALTTKHVTISKEVNLDDSLEDDRMVTSLEIVAPTTVVTKTDPGYSDSANKSPKPSSFSRRHSDIFRTSILDVSDHTEKWTSITLGTNRNSSYRTDIETNSMDISNTSFDIPENPVSSIPTISTMLEFASFLPFNNITEKDNGAAKSQRGFMTTVIDIRPSSSFSSLSTLAPSFSSSPSPTSSLSLLLSTLISSSLSPSSSLSSSLSSSSSSSSLALSSFSSTSLSPSSTSLSSSPLMPSMSLSSLISTSILSSFSPSSTLWSSLSSSSLALSSFSSITLTPSSPSLSSSSSTLLTLNEDNSKNEQGQQPPSEETTDGTDVVVKSDDKEIKIEININNNIIQEEIPDTTAGTTSPTSTTPQQRSQLSLELMVVCAYMCQQRGLPIPPFCGCTLQAWLR
ncbi:uncharacterized protein [Argopecten irradians]|uniref:uncharacterized protein n=1 Tax=Argopecten irradians TaxID=31199 RepID=UPI003710D8AF